MRFARVVGLTLFTLVHSADADTLGASDIQRVVTTNRAALKRCYDAARAKSPTLRVRLRVRVVISPTGRVTTARDDGSELPNDAVLACVLDVLRKATFPTSDSETNVLIPLNFVPPDPPDASADARAD